MTLFIDPPRVPAHGRTWSHLASDSSLAELHDFARAAGIPERGFDRDHYDVPGEYYEAMVAAGAVPVSSRELIVRLAGSGLRRRKATTLGRRGPGRPLARPPRLRPGSLVAVIAPAGPAAPERVVEGERVLRDWGLEVRSARLPVEPELPWLAGPDDHRATALEEAWTDPDVAAVWCTRGGFGSQRLLDLLDWTALATAGPKWLIGFSDVTALHQAFAARLGLATVHGPGVAGLPTVRADAAEALRALLFERTIQRLTGTPGGGGVAEGVLVGGNLAVLAALAGTPDSRPARDSIALLEDVGEAPYRLDRMLTQLLQAGWFDGVRGIACGDFTDCGDPALVARVLRARLGPLGVPMVLDLPIGHLRANFGVPLGRPVRIDGDVGTLG